MSPPLGHSAAGSAVLWSDLGFVLLSEVYRLHRVVVFSIITRVGAVAKLFVYAIEPEHHAAAVEHVNGKPSNCKLPVAPENDAVFMCKLQYTVFPIFVYVQRLLV
jgi:hypothetical protein